MLAGHSRVPTSHVSGASAPGQPSSSKRSATKIESSYDVWQPRLLSRPGPDPGLEGAPFSIGMSERAQSLSRAKNLPRLRGDEGVCYAQSSYRSRSQRSHTGKTSDLDWSAKHPLIEHDEISVQEAAGHEGSSHSLQNASLRGRARSRKTSSDGRMARRVLSEGMLQQSPTDIGNEPRMGESFGPGENSVAYERHTR